MPHYYFHTIDGGRICDEEGVDCADDHAARLMAIRFAADVLRDQPELLDDGDFRVEMTDADRNTRFLVVAVTVKSGDAAAPSG